MENSIPAEIKIKKSWSEWYDKHHKILLVIPVALFILAIIFMFSFHSKNGDFIFKDSSLSGGTTITLNFEVDFGQLESSLNERFSDVNVRTINDFATGNQIAVIIDSSADPETLQSAIEEFTGTELTSENSNIEFSGPSLGQNFYKQLSIAVLISFILMSFVIFFLFRTFIPSIAVIFAAFSDIVLTLAAVNILGVRFSAAGIAAFLMLIGYSVDTDILLTTRVLKKRDSPLNQRIYGSFKTGILMTLTALAAVLPAFLVVTGLPDSFRQIFLILAFGLGADIINTWLANASILKWYAEAKGIQ